MENSTIKIITMLIGTLLLGIFVPLAFEFNYDVEQRITHTAVNVPYQTKQFTVGGSGNGSAKGFIIFGCTTAQTNLSLSDMAISYNNTFQTNQTFQLNYETVFILLADIQLNVSGNFTSLTDVEELDSTPIWNGSYPIAKLMYVQHHFINLTHAEVDFKVYKNSTQSNYRLVGQYA